MITSASPEFALKVLIEKNIEEIDFYEKTKEINGRGEIKRKPKPVQIVVHEPSKPPNFRTQSFTIPLGHSTTVYITPRATRTDTSGQSLAEDKRRCRLERESEGLKIYKKYSRESCMFECQMFQAVQRCGCYPWDYPVTKEGNFFLCDIYGNICFESILANFSTALSCHCPMDCDSVSYSYSIVSTPILEREECSAKGKDSLFQEFYDKPFPPKFITRVRELLGKTNSSKAMFLCKRMLPYRAEVTFRLATDTVSVTVRSRRLSFFDKLSGFGKILPSPTFT